MLMILLLIGCGTDYTVRATCSTDDDGLIACTQPVDHATAVRTCESLGAELVVVNDFDELTEVKAVGQALLTEPWWVGWTDYECPGMGFGGGASPRDCTELNPFICQGK